MTEIYHDIRKLYLFRRPSDELAGLIEFFSETSQDSMFRHIGTEVFTVKLFPSFTPTIWINLGTPYLLQNGNEHYEIPSNGDIILLRNEIVERTNLPTDNIFTIKFNPGGFESVFGISQSLIGSHVLPVTHFIPAPLIKKLKRSAGLDDRIRLLEQYFVDKMEAQRSGNHQLKYVTEAIRIVESGNWSAGNAGLAKQLCITEKSLYRYFNDAVGVNPKTYFSFARARTALTSWVKDPSGFEATEFGYYDRSHFYKDVRRLTGSKLNSGVEHAT
ncbi:AraC family transcriptional regulator [Pseudoflavitalea sp. G-6-1-2]|uniref:AraC family transcriptional regulator n=1 Tax=Pseudoflavitalea sp. G-6-1-2 TaxID=2728841 RepID=UPI00146ACDA2|nr:helix-turn-helix domain-containing protein [Pseudoflavitalea sp. G-6-1-2]NML22030.1 AraC family transcriptional regulator [Pseudoflavitalea sp. G-6-1-2]